MLNVSVTRLGFFMEKQDTEKKGALLATLAEIWVSICIEQFEKNRFLALHYKVIKIDVGHLSQIEIYLSDTFKIIFDQTDIPKKIQMLHLFLSQAKVKEDEVNYIDLRFKEPIVGRKAGE